jgi:hypothetical protein
VLPDNSWCNIPKWEKYTKVAIKYTQWPLNIPKSSEIDLKAITLPTSFFLRHFGNYPNWILV